MFMLDDNIERLLDEAPQEAYAGIVGLDVQIRCIRRTVELPLTHPELYENRICYLGVLLIGPPGSGKTLLAEAVANQTSADIMRVSCSDIILRHLEDTSEVIRELFRAVAELAPSILLIDDIEALVPSWDPLYYIEQNLLQSIRDTFICHFFEHDFPVNFKVIMTTHGLSYTDRRLLLLPLLSISRIYMDMPNMETLYEIFNIHTSRMTLADDVNLRNLIMTHDFLCGGDIKAICTEAGHMAVREQRMRVNNEDFIQAKEIVLCRRGVYDEPVLETISELIRRRRERERMSKKCKNESTKKFMKSKENVLYPRR